MIKFNNFLMLLCPGFMVQGYDAIRYDRKKNNGITRFPPYPCNPESSPQRFRQLHMRSGQPTWENTENRSINRYVRKPTKPIRSFI